MSTKSETKEKTMELTFTRTIPATPAEVFGAWMDPKHPGNPWASASKLILDARVDGLFFFSSGKEESWPHYGRFLAIERNQRAQYTWMSKFTRGLESIVTVTFEAKDGDTLVTLTHTNLPDDDYGRLHDDGWAACLGLFIEQFAPRRKA